MLQELIIWLLPLIIAYVAYNERDKIKIRARNVMSREETEKLIDLKMIENRVVIREIKEDVTELKGKLDQIIKLLLRRSN